MIYIASPYTHDDPDVRAMRAHKAAEYAAWLMATKGLDAYSPVAHGHALVTAYPSLAVPHERWMEHCLRMLKWCDDDMHILTLAGWHESKGIRIEISQCVLNQTSIIFVPQLYAEPKPD